MPDFDDILAEIGEFGRYQTIVYLFLCLPIFFSAGNNLAYVFTAGVPNYRCYVQGCDNVTAPEYDGKWVPNAIPPASEEGPYVPNQCLQYVPRFNLTQGMCFEEQFEQKTVKCDRWVFQDGERTIVGEWNITCAENLWKLSLVGTVHFLGYLSATMVFGVLGDRYGRKSSLLLSIGLMSVAGVAQALSHDYILFQFFVFVHALGIGGSYFLAFILAVELVGPRKREMSGVVLNYFYAVGEASVGVVAWLAKDWVIIQLASSIPPILCLTYYWIVPESVRWLLANNDTKSAGVIVKKAAKINGVVLSTDLLSLVENQKSAGKDALKTPNSGVWLSVKQLIKSRVLCVRTLILFYLWAVSAFVFYGLSMNSTTLGGNKYLNFVLVCLVEIPGYTLSWWGMNKLGRRWSFCSSFLLCGITCVAAAFVPTDINWAVVLLFLFGKIGVTASFQTAYVYTAELYPTVIRSVGVGACSTVGRLGAVVAPFAPLLGQYSKPLPLLMFSGVSLLAAVLSWWLPETLGTKLPDTVEEAANLKVCFRPNLRATIMTSPPSHGRFLHAGNQVDESSPQDEDMQLASQPFLHRIGRQ